MSRQLRRSRVVLRKTERPKLTPRRMMKARLPESDVQCKMMCVGCRWILNRIRRLR